MISEREISRRQTKITQWLGDVLSPIQVIGPEKQGPKRKELPPTEADHFLWWIIVAGKRRLLIPKPLLEHFTDQTSDIIEALARQGLAEQVEECRRWVLGAEFDLTCGGR
jgi:hypothetical protein